MNETIDQETGEVLPEKNNGFNLPVTLPGKEIAKAIIKAQAALVGKIKKDGANSHLKSKYPTLSGILEEAIPILTENGILLTQVARSWENGLFVVDTILFHPESGEHWSTPFPIPIPLNPTPQQLGSANSYGRRYGILSVLCLSGVDDDDGTASSNRSDRLGQNQVQGRGQQRNNHRQQGGNQQRNNQQGQRPPGALANTMAEKIKKMIDPNELDRADSYIKGKPDEEISPADKQRLAEQIKERKEHINAANAA